MPSASIPTSQTEQALLKHLADVVEPLTRFDASALESLGVVSETIPFTARLRFQVAFRIQREAKAGALPGHIPDLLHPDTLTQHLQTAHRNAYALLPQKLRNWQQRFANDPDAQPAEPDCLADDALSGYEGGCIPCSETGQVICRRCDGQTQHLCDPCEGRGKQPCRSCGAQGVVICTACNGRGSWTEERTRNYTTGTHGDQEWHTEIETVLVTCGSCSGTGRRACPYCYNGEVVCENCKGRKYVPCETCGATGAVSCGNCRGTGRLHVLSFLRCEITPSFSVEAYTPRLEVQQRLASLQSLGQLRALAPLSPYAAQYGDDDMERVYSDEMEVTILSLRTAGVSLSILGYGVNARIFDYKNIVGHLLQADLEALETALQTAARQPLRARFHLEPALTHFLASPANAQLGRQAFQSQTSPASLSFPAAVSPDYADRAVAALGESSARVYHQYTPLTFAGLLLLPLPVLFCADSLHLLSLGLYSPVLSALAMGFAALGLEFVALQRVRRLLGPALSAMAPHALAAQGALQKRRRLLIAGVLGGALLGWIGAAMLAAFLWTRAH